MSELVNNVFGLAQQLGHIFYFIVLPMLLLIGLGFFVQKRMRLDMHTLTALNFYFVIPGMIYYAVVSSQVTFRDAAMTVVMCLCLMLTMAAVTLLAARLRRLPAEYHTPLVMSTIFYNAGNYGLPLQNLVYGSEGLGGLAMSMQSFIIITQNFTAFTVGVFLAAGRQQRHWRENLAHVVKFPPVYALVAALLTVQVRQWLGDAAPAVGNALSPAWQVIGFIKDGFIAIALFTLGAQMALVRPVQHAYPVKMSVILRLLIGPAITIGVIYLLGIKGMLAQMLLLGTATPTGVNVVLLCTEFNNHPDFAARAVFYSTLLSPLTVTATIFLMRSGLLSGLGF